MKGKYTESEKQARLRQTKIEAIERQSIKRLANNTNTSTSFNSTI